MKALLVLALLPASLLVAAEPPAGLPSDPWAFTATEFLETCSLTRHQEQRASLSPSDPEFSAKATAFLSRLAFCQALVIGVTESVQALGAFGLLPGGCAMDGISYASVYTTAANHHRRNPKDWSSVRASHLILFSLFEAYPCGATK
jgi:hypothetical protein